LVATALVVTVNVAVVAAAATVTVAGTVAAAVLLLLSATTAPPDGAGPLRVTVPVDGVPPVTDVGFTPRELTTGGVTVKAPLFVVLLYVAEMFTSVLLATGLVVTVNVPVVSPAATGTLAGTVAAAVLSLASVTTAPPAGAAPLNVTVPADEVPPVTDVGLMPTELTTGGVTVKSAVTVALL
jgi:hypothetical protein